MAKGTNIRYPEHIRKFLEIESEKLGVPLSEVAIKTLDNAIKGNPILTSITGIEQQREQEKLGIEIERHRKLKNDNDFFDKHGYYPTKPARFVTEVIEQPQPRQTEWTGDQYKAKTPHKETTYEPEISLEDWKLVFPTLTDFDKSKNMHKCIVQNCGQAFQNAETARRHIIDNHESILQENLREMKRMMST